MVWLGRNPIAHDVAVSTAVAQALNADDKYSSVSAVGFWSEQQMHSTQHHRSR